MVLRCGAVMKKIYMQVYMYREVKGIGISCNIQTIPYPPPKCRVFMHSVAKQGRSPLVPLSTMPASCESQEQADKVTQAIDRDTADVSSRRACEKGTASQKCAKKKKAYQPGTHTKLYTSNMVLHYTLQVRDPLLTLTMPTALSALEASLRSPDTACPVVLRSSLDSTTATRGVGTPFCPITCRTRKR